MNVDNIYMLLHISKNVTSYVCRDTFILTTTPINLPIYPTLFTRESHSHKIDGGLVASMEQYVCKETISLLYKWQWDSSWAVLETMAIF